MVLRMYLALETLLPSYITCLIVSIARIRRCAGKGLTYTIEGAIVDRCQFTHLELSDIVLIPYCGDGRLAALKHRLIFTLKRNAPYINDHSNQEADHCTMYTLEAFPLVPHLLRPQSSINAVCRARRLLGAEVPFLFIPRQEADGRDIKDARCSEVSTHKYEESTS